jgi:hypothetical protein
MVVDGSNYDRALPSLPWFETREDALLTMRRRRPHPEEARSAVSKDGSTAVSL